MTPEARALTQALLDHRKRVREAQSERKLDIDLCLIPYGELCDSAGLPNLKPTVGKCLREIAEWCHENGWPPLNSLAVNRATRRPGRGYDSAPGCSLQHWRSEAGAAIEFDRYPDRMP